MSLEVFPTIMILWFCECVTALIRTDVLIAIPVLI